MYWLNINLSYLNLIAMLFINNQKSTAIKLNNDDNDDDDDENRSGGVNRDVSCICNCSGYVQLELLASDWIFL